MSIKAIETTYNGYRFRSRLEARWAVFFDAMDEKWEYEKEGYNLNGVRYLPDFFLPRLNSFVEIKGAEPTMLEKHKGYLLRNETGCAVALLYGIPGEYWGELYAWVIGDSSGGWSTQNAMFGADQYGLLTFFVPELHPDHALLLDAAMSHVAPACQIEAGNIVAQNAIQSAIAYAKGARFEHGEKPKVSVSPRIKWRLESLGLSNFDGGGRDWWIEEEGKPGESVFYCGNDKDCPSLSKRASLLVEAHNTGNVVEENRLLLTLKEEEQEYV